MAPGRKQLRKGNRASSLMIPAIINEVVHEEPEAPSDCNPQPVENVDIHEEAIVPSGAGENGSSSAKSGRKRGPSRGFSREKREKLNNKVFELHFPPGKWGVVGRDADVFNTELGIIVRMKAPLRVHLWQDMTTIDKEPMFVHLASMFGLNFGIEHVRDVTDFLLQGRYSDYRGQLYKYIRSFSSIVEARKKPYRDVDGDDWNLVCDYVMTAKFKKRSKVNAENRGRAKSNHCSGSKSFLRRREELKDKNVGRIDFYKLTHCKEGVWAAEKAEENYNAMIALKEKPIAEGTIPMTEDQICDQVLGITPGYLSGLGRSERRKSSSIGETYQNELVEAKSRAEQAEKTAEQAEKRADELTAEVESQRATIVELNEKTNKLVSMFDMLASQVYNGNPSMFNMFASQMRNGSSANQ